MVEFDRFDHFAILRAEGEGMIQKNPIIINSPTQSVVVDTQLNQAPAHEPVSEAPDPQNQEYGNPKMSEMMIEPLNPNTPNPLVSHNKI